MIGGVWAKLYSPLESHVDQSNSLQWLILSYWENCRLLMWGDKDEKSCGRAVGSARLRGEKPIYKKQKAYHWTQVPDEPGSLQGVWLWELLFASESNGCCVIESCSHVSWISSNCDERLHERRKTNLFRNVNFAPHDLHIDFVTFR